MTDGDKDSPNRAGWTRTSRRPAGAGQSGRAWVKRQAEYFETSRRGSGPSIRPDPGGRAETRGLRPGPLYIGPPKSGCPRLCRRYTPWQLSRLAQWARADPRRSRTDGAGGRLQNDVAP